MAIPTEQVLGSEMPMNTWGHATILVGMLYSQGLLPVTCHVYGVGEDEENPEMMYINGEPLGITTDEVLHSIWKMVNCYKRTGCLFE
jgi:hypothetical protein